MKIMTFNTQHCRNFVTGKIDFEVMAEAIRKEAPEIVGLNEMRDGDTPMHFDRQCKFKEGDYGNGLITKHKIISAETIHVPDPNPRRYDGYYEHRVLLKAKLENGLTVLVIHFGLNPDEAENAVATVIENIASEKCILMGDFNVLPDDKVLLPIREKMKDTALCFDTELLSFPSDLPKAKIDYVFVSPDIEVMSADIPAIVASDHRPHTAQIKF